MRRLSRQSICGTQDGEDAPGPVYQAPIVHHTADFHTARPLPKLGQNGLVYGEPCVVRYIGTLSVEESITLLGRRKGMTNNDELHILGVECTDNERGKSNGSVHGRKYFECPPNRGLFILPHAFMPFTIKDYCAIRIQRAWRGYAGRCRNRHVAALRSWGIIESLEESNLLETTEVENMVGREVRKELAVEEVGKDFPDFGEEEISQDYAGPRYPGPGHEEFAWAIYEHYKDPRNVPLPRPYVCRILRDIESYLRDFNPTSVLRFTVPSRDRDSRLICVGDVHGQLKDVVWIFYKFGVPSPNNVYLFNGDIADRGVYAVEIFILLFSFMLAYPNDTVVIINRGNHEEEGMNNVYGFTQEVREKYGGLVFKMFLLIFRRFPLCVVLNSTVLVVHGGLVRHSDVTLSEIDALDRNRKCPTAPETREDEIMFDLLWSDPQNAPGRGFNKRGRECIVFGPDVTDEFLTHNDLEVVLRSHQVPSNLRGFESVHDGRVVTLFSASDYCGTMGNLGGVIIFEKELSFEIVEYMSPSVEDLNKFIIATERATEKVLTKSQMMEMSSQVEERALMRSRRSSFVFVEKQSLKKIQWLFCEKRQALADRFRAIDVSRTGRITVAEWRDGCAEIICENLPWLYVQKRLDIEMVDFNMIDYNKFLSRFRVEFRPKDVRHENWRHLATRHIFEAMMLADLSLRETLMIIDRNNDGQVNIRDLQEFLAKLKLDLSPSQIKILLRLFLLSLSEGPKINTVEFLGRFKLFYSNAIRESTQAPAWVIEALESIGKCLVTNKSDLAKRHYKSVDGMDRRRSSALRTVALYEQFKEWSEREKEPTDETTKLQTELIHDLDAEIEEVAAKCESSPSNEAQTELEKLYLLRERMFKSFTKQDELPPGYLSYLGFVTSMRNLHVNFEPIRKAINLWRLAEALDIANSGRINFVEFLNAFHMAKTQNSAEIVAELWSEVCLGLYQNQHTIRNAMRQFDPYMTGFASVEDFRSVLYILNQSIHRSSRPDRLPLTNEQIDLLSVCMSANSDEKINYEEFCQSFVCVDTQKDKLKYGGEMVDCDAQEIEQLMNANLPSVIRQDASDTNMYQLDNLKKSTKKLRWPKVDNSSGG
eukprot:GHVO01040948.1.p1 GENE.GHVO01040948.1~~GHVO01040948.1.p1  ORF type:complete len:1106 (+),score=182.30 GHVO01040948.1:262-3579(+)